MLRSEVYLLQGRFEAALSLATGCLGRKDLEPVLRARALRIVGSCGRELGAADGTRALEEAALLARALGNWPLFSRIQLAILEHGADEQASYASSVARCGTTIRSVLRCGDRSLLVEAHLTFARLEARIGHFDVARRHLSQGEQLLNESPNDRLHADLVITEGAVLAAEGDLPAAITLTREALNLSAKCGWWKGEAVSAGNLAFFCAGCGDVANAEDYLLQATGGKYHAPSFDYAMLDTAALIAITKGDDVAAESIWHRASASSEGVQGWYRLQLAHTRTQILLRQGKAADALQFAEQQLNRAEELGNQFFVRMFELTVANLRLRHGQLHNSSCFEYGRNHRSH